LQSDWRAIGDKIADEARITAVCCTQKMCLGDAEARKRRERAGVCTNGAAESANGTTTRLVAGDSLGRTVFGRRWEAGLGSSFVL